MNLRITWNSGVQIEHDEVKVILDAKRNSIDGSAFFITHGHLDHSAAFKIKHAQKYSSKETLDIISNFGFQVCLLYTSPSPRDAHESRMPSSA